MAWKKNYKADSLQADKEILPCGTRSGGV